MRHTPHWQVCVGTFGEGAGDLQKEGGVYKIDPLQLLYTPPLQIKLLRSGAKAVTTSVHPSKLFLRKLIGLQVYK